MAVRCFEIFVTVNVFASWTAALYSACGFVWAELPPLQEVRARHETAKKIITKWASNENDFRRRVFIFPP
jgi:hypothetical protein